MDLTKYYKIYSLYPDVKQKYKDEYYATVSLHPDGTATLFLWGSPIYTVDLSNDREVYKEPNLNSKAKKIVSDFKKHIKQITSYTDFFHCLYFNGELIDSDFDGLVLFEELYQLLEDAEANGDDVDIPNCYLSRVPVVRYKDGSSEEPDWANDATYFRITNPKATISDVLDIMDKAPFR